jgi:Cu-Zn family superoxide dismutase
MDCCKHNKTSKICIRKNDKKKFNLPRRFSMKKCKNPRGFTMRSSCAPYKNCFKGGAKTRRAHCMLKKSSSVSGNIFFQETLKNKLAIYYNISGLTPGEHGFHIHEKGDLAKKCMNCGKHFNPNKKHHCYDSKNCHSGDLGNIFANSKGNSRGIKIVSNICLNKNKSCNILRRSVVVHENKDDLGKGKNHESHKTGNAGRRIACGIIEELN